MRISHIVIAAGIALAAAPVAANNANPQIDYDGFVALTLGLKQTREAHRLPLEDFLARARSDGAILLDTRSAEAFRQGHIAGAVNLPFSDFTSDALAKVLGADGARPIFIYCNNNFTDNAVPVMSKKAPLALNIPTFINLHGYGYTNVWELADAVPTTAVEWITAEAS